MSRSGVSAATAGHPGRRWCIVPPAQPGADALSRCRSATRRPPFPYSSSPPAHPEAGSSLTPIPLPPARQLARQPCLTVKGVVHPICVVDDVEGLAGCHLQVPVPWWLRHHVQVQVHVLHAAQPQGDAEAVHLLHPAPGLQGEGVGEGQVGQG